MQESLEIIETAGAQAMAELHRMLRLMRAEGVDVDADVSPQPTVADISSLTGLAVAAGRDVQLIHDGAPGALDPSVEVAAYRVVQEALTNSLNTPALRLPS